MFPTALLIASLLLTVSVAANHIVVRDAPVSLSLTRRLKFTNSLDLVRRDQARVKHLVALGKAEKSGTSTQEATASIPVTNGAVDYVASVGVGSPPTYYTLIVDTGSSNTWIGAEKHYVKTKTSVQTRDSVAVSYGTGLFLGTEYLDTVTLAPNVAIPRQSIGVADFSYGINGVDGILGIGPTDLTIGTLSPDTTSSIPTITNNLFSRRIIPLDLVSISFEPTIKNNSKNGELTFGGTDRTKFTGDITYIPITKTYPAREFWGIDQSIQYGKSTSILKTTAGIVDTGTTLIYIATDAFHKYTVATGAVLDSTTGLLRITRAQYKNLEPLFFMVRGGSFELTANAQIWPRALNTMIGGRADYIYLVVNDIGTVSGQGFDFVNGYTFLERFYSVYDTGNSRVGFATTPFTESNIN